MNWNASDTAVVFIDPQNDVLSPTGINWAATGASVTENDTVAHMLALTRRPNTPPSSWMLSKAGDSTRRTVPRPSPLRSTWPRIAERQRYSG